MTTADDIREYIEHLCAAQNPDVAARVITKMYLLIDRADLPEMDDYRAKSLFDYYTASSDLRALKTKALTLLAAVEHLEHNPPIDEAQVDALADLIRGNVGRVGEHESYDDLATRLYRAGVRIEVDQ